MERFVLPRQLTLLYSFNTVLCKLFLKLFSFKSSSSETSPWRSPLITTSFNHKVQAESQKEHILPENFTLRNSGFGSWVNRAGLICSWGLEEAHDSKTQTEILPLHGSTETILVGQATSSAFTQLPAVGGVYTCPPLQLCSHRIPGSSQSHAFVPCLPSHSSISLQELLCPYPASNLSLDLCDVSLVWDSPLDPSDSVHFRQGPNSANGSLSRLWIGCIPSFPLSSMGPRFFLSHQCSLNICRVAKLVIV